MAISFVAAAEQATTNTSSISIAKPSGTASGDVLILWVAGHPSALAQRTFTSSGFTVVRTMHDTDNSGNQRLSACILKKVAGGSEPSSYTVTASGTCGIMWGGISAYRGATGQLVAEGYGADSDQTSPVSSATVNNTQEGAWRLTGGAAVNDTNFSYTVASSEVSVRWGDTSWRASSQTGYGLAAKQYDSNGPVATGNTSRTFQNGGSQQWYAAVCWVGILQEGGATPATGSFGATMPKLSAAVSGEVKIPAVVGCEIPPVEFAGDGYGQPPPVDCVMSASIPAAVADVAAASVPSALLDVTVLPMVNIVAETKPFGIRVIAVDAESRVIRVPSRGVED